MILRKKKINKKRSELTVLSNDGFAKIISRKIIKESIVALLEVYSHFKTPRNIYMERDIRQLYDEVENFYLFKNLI